MNVINVVKVANMSPFSADHTYGSEYGNCVHLKTVILDKVQTAELQSSEMDHVNGNGDCFQFFVFSTWKV